ncbi:hypothetical protein [Enterobacter asburiae]|uniref:hypothetical protein n=1 Tax=Enterobacter asburiae TaxID=61645 RepID=UPI00210D515E|nr:hypothetical protein [Enterobacter asburiae]MCQ4370010.1 hypothetical protein [Enterobacter asburiae]HDC4620390.1 hypothetical protein [Enterobacter asburiae]
MKLNELVDFLLANGVGEYQVSVLPEDFCIARPLTESQILVSPETIVEMIAARDAIASQTDL